MKIQIVETATNLRGNAFLDLFALKIFTPESFIVVFPARNVGAIIFNEGWVKPSPDAKTIKLLTFVDLLPLQRHSRSENL